MKRTIMIAPPASLSTRPASASQWLTPSPKIPPIRPSASSRLLTEKEGFCAACPFLENMNE